MSKKMNKTATNHNVSSFSTGTSGTKKSPNLKKTVTAAADSVSQTPALLNNSNSAPLLPIYDAISWNLRQMYHLSPNDLLAD